MCPLVYLDTVVDYMQLKTIRKMYLYGKKGIYGAFNDMNITYIGGASRSISEKNISFIALNNMATKKQSFTFYYHENDQHGCKLV